MVDANFTFNAPKIKRLIIGSNINENDKSKVVEIWKR